MQPSSTNPDGVNISIQLVFRPFFLWSLQYILSNLAPLKPASRIAWVQAAVPAKNSSHWNSWFSSRGCFEFRSSIPGGSKLLQSPKHIVQIHACIQWKSYLVPTSQDVFRDLNWACGFCWTPAMHSKAWNMSGWRLFCAKRFLTRLALDK